MREYIAGGEDTSLTNGIPAGLTLETEGRVDTNNPGVYVISYTVSSTRGSTLYEGYARLIVVVEA